MVGLPVAALGAALEDLGLAPWAGAGGDGGRLAATTRGTMSDEKRYAIIHEADGDTIWRWQRGRKARFVEYGGYQKAKALAGRGRLDPGAAGLPVRAPGRPRRRERGRHPGGRGLRAGAAGHARLSDTRPAAYQRAGSAPAGRRVGGPARGRQGPPRRRPPP